MTRGTGAPSRLRPSGTSDLTEHCVFFAGRRTSEVYLTKDRKGFDFYAFISVVSAFPNQILSHQHLSQFVVQYHRATFFFNIFVWGRGGGVKVIQSLFENFI